MVRLILGVGQTEITMIKPNDPRWEEWCGGYGIAASLSKFIENVIRKSMTFDQVWEYVWDEMHHQGDVGSGSYAIFPFLVGLEQDNENYFLNILQYATCLECPDRIHDVVPDDVIESYNSSRDELLMSAIRKTACSIDEQYCLYSLIAAKNKSSDMIKLMRFMCGTDPKVFLENYK